MKILKKKTLKSTNGITLIALVITIIVLLILAGISISMLSGDNGILQRATDAKERTGVAEVVENAKLDVLAQIAENKGENISKDQFKSILNKYFENIATLELPDNLSNSDIKLNANETYGGYKNIALSEIYSGTFSNTNITPSIDYGSKTAQTIRRGEDLTIGTEKFMVIKKENGIIMAMPYYNLKLDATPIKQITQENATTESYLSTNRIQFSSLASPSWNANEDINLDIHENNVKSYIDSYQTTLRNLGATDVTVRIARYSELYSFFDTSNLYELGNPSGIGLFYLGSSASSPYYIRFMSNNGNMDVVGHNYLGSEEEGAPADIARSSSYYTYSV